MAYAADDPQVQERNAAFLQGLQQLAGRLGRTSRSTTAGPGVTRMILEKYAGELVALAPDVIFHAAVRCGHCGERAHSGHRVY